jgi:hypothetical protein
MLSLFNHSESEAILSVLNTTIDFSHAKDELIAQLGAGIAGVSLLASLFILVSYYKFPKLRTFAFELILMIAISDILRDVSYIMTPLIDPSLCMPQALLMTFSEIASMFWVSSIAFTIHRTLLLDNCGPMGWRESVKYHIFCWGVSLLFTLLPLTTSDYDQSNVLWCWINYESTLGKVWLFVCYYIPVFLMLVYLIYVYGQVWWMLEARPLTRASTIDSKKPKHRLVTQRRMAIYPSIFFFSFLFTCLDSVYEIVQGKRNFYLALLDVVTSGLQGMQNAFVYGLTTAVRLEWIEYCCPHRRVKDHYISFNEHWRYSNHALDIHSPLRDHLNYEDQMFSSRSSHC